MTADLKAGNFRARVSPAAVLLPFRTLSDEVAIQFQKSGIPTLQDSERSVNRAALTGSNRQCAPNIIAADLLFKAYE